MPASLLATKLYIPPASPRRVGRPRLIERLDEVLAKKLTLLSAPAGFGKTTLLSEWIHEKRNPVAWVSLDASDNDPARFLTYLVAALQTVQPDLGQSVQALVQSAQPPPTEAMLTTLINEMTTFRRDLVLVLDDYHAIENQQAHIAITFLLDHLPPLLHMIISSRADPPIPLARLRARGELLEIRAADLRFTPAEAADFLNEAMSLSLASEDVAALETRTEGWIAGLQMAAISMQGRHDVRSFIASFSGSHRYVLDYLIDEVFRQQPDHIQRFLLQTSVLDRMCAALCDEVTGMKDSQTLLETLERANVFVFPLDDERQWYRYHHLFSDLLRARLRQTDPEKAQALQRTACEWHAQQGLIDEAISYALAAQDIGRTADLVERNASAMLAQGRLAGLMRWADLLPEEYIAARPRLGLAHAWALLFNSQIEHVETRLKQIEEKTPPEAATRIAGQVAVIRATAARLLGQIDRSIAFSQQALELLPASSLALRSQALLTIGQLNRTIDVKKSQQAFTEASALGETSGNPNGTLTALYLLAHTEALGGALRQSAATSERALQLADKQPLLPAAGHAHLAMAEYLYETNQLEQAKDHLEKAIELSEPGGINDLLALALLALARLHRVCMEWKEAQRLIDRASQVAAQITMSTLKMRVDYEQVLLWLAMGKHREALALARKNIESTENVPTFPLAQRQIAVARVLIAQRQQNEALALLAQASAEVEKAGMMSHSLQILSLRALALRVRDQFGSALAELTQAVTQAMPEGYIRTFVDEGQPMKSLLFEFSSSLEKQLDGQSSADRTELQAYVKVLLAAFSLSELETSTLQTQNLVVPLSERELEVLRLVAAGKSNQEIATALTLATGTVKKHINNIFGKLSVESRTQAIAQAHVLNLL